MMTDSAQRRAERDLHAEKIQKAQTHANMLIKEWTKKAKEERQKLAAALSPELNKGPGPYSTMASLLSIVYAIALTMPVMILSYWLGAELSTDTALLAVLSGGLGAGVFHLLVECHWRRKAVEHARKVDRRCEELGLDLYQRGWQEIKS